MSILYIGNYSNNEMNMLNINNKMLIMGTNKLKVKRSNPSYICINNEFLYSVAEIQDTIVNSGYVLAYKITDNRLEF